MVQSTPIVSSDGASGTVVGTIDSGGGVCSYVDIIKETNETNSPSGERPSGSGDTKIGRKAGMAESKRWGYGDASALFASASSAAAGGSTFDASALRRELVQRDTVIAELAGGAAQQAQDSRIGTPGRVKRQLMKAPTNCRTASSMHAASEME